MKKTYTVEFDNNAKKEFKKLDKSIQRLILAWLKKNIQSSSDPRSTGKGLTSNKKGLWRYRIGKYRVICDIQDDIALVLVITVGNHLRLTKMLRSGAQTIDEKNRSAVFFRQQSERGYLMKKTPKKA